MASSLSDSFRRSLPMSQICVVPCATVATNAIAGTRSGMSDASMQIACGLVLGSLLDVIACDAACGAGGAGAAGDVCGVCGT